eukprot:13838256-Alexandrium_andersonii.AAC.1
MVALLPVLVADLRRPWWPLATATDASEWGYGVCERPLAPQQQAELAAWQERWRFERLPPE